MHANGKMFNESVRRLASKIARRESDLHQERVWIPVWRDHMHAKLGAILAAMLIKVAKISVPKTKVLCIGLEMYVILILEKKMKWSKPFSM